MASPGNLDLIQEEEVLDFDDDKQKRADLDMSFISQTSNSNTYVIKGKNKNGKLVLKANNVNKSIDRGVKKVKTRYESQGNEAEKSVKMQKL